MPIVTAPGVGQGFEVDSALGPDGGQVFWLKLVIGPRGTSILVEDADGKRVPTLGVLRDPSGIEVSVADSALQAVRTHITSGAGIAQLGIDGADFQVDVDGGVPQLYLSGVHPPMVAGLKAGVLRMSRQRILAVGAPPRDLQVQTDTPVRLTNTAEVQLLPPGAAGVYHDLRNLFVTTNFVVQQDPSIEVHLRDTTTGTIRWSAALSEKSGAENPFPVYRNQTTPASSWTVQLSAAPPAGRAVIINVEAEKRLD